MSKAQDFIQDSNGDILISDGDLVIGDSDQEHINDILIAAPNWWKESPQIGVNIQTYLSGSNIGPELTRNIKLQLVADGYTLTKASFSNNLQTNTLEFTTDAEKV